MSKATRRAVVGAIAASPALAVPAFASAAPNPDPIFAAIETRKRAHAAFEAACSGASRAYDRLADNEEMDQLEEEASRCGRINANVSRTMLRTVPTTLAGVHALVRYVHERGECGDDIMMLYMGPEDNDREARQVLIATLATALDNIVDAVQS
jgi:hypothetical protein